jgi:adenylosuccinate lyase
MHVTVRCDLLKVLETGNSTLQRELRYSNVMRSYAEIAVALCQQLLTTRRIFASFSVHAARCDENLDRVVRFTVAELLHLSLQRAGYPDAHTFVNKKLVPFARRSQLTLQLQMDLYLDEHPDPALKRAWAKVPDEIRRQLALPRDYVGNALELTRSEATYYIT